MAPAVGPHRHGARFGARGGPRCPAAAANAVPVAEYTLAAVLFSVKGVFSFIELERDRSARVPLPSGPFSMRVYRRLSSSSLCAATLAG